MWQCSKTDTSGKRCMAKAICRLHFAKDHPFDFFDVCEEHLHEYSGFYSVQLIKELDEYQEKYNDRRKKGAHT